MKFSGLFKALTKTRASVTQAINKVLGKQVNDETLEELESQLIIADLGFHTVNKIIDMFNRNNHRDIKTALKEYLISELKYDRRFVSSEDMPVVIFVVGVNGAGKTTTSAKLAHYFLQRGDHPLLVGADTYRAAAVEQLQLWSNRLKIKCISNEKTNDPSAVVYDGLKSAESSRSNVVIVDTAGRLHTNSDLLNELNKMERIVKTKFSYFKLRSLLIMDANIGQNSLQQAKEFQQAIQIDGAILTKMDGTAKGGIVFPLNQQFNVPVYFFGIGEDMDSLIPFNGSDYVSSLISN